MDADKHYELRGLNQFAFEWRTPETSFWLQPKVSNLPFAVNLKFNDEGVLQTLEKEELHVSVQYDFSCKLCELAMNKVYHMRVSLILEEKMDENLDIKISNIDGKIQPSKHPKAD